MLDLLLVGPYDGVKHLGEEAEKGYVRPLTEIETLVGEDPVIVPVEIVESVLINVALGGAVPGVVALHLLQVENALEEPNLIQPAGPSDLLQAQGIEKASSGYLSDTRPSVNSPLHYKG